ncbi:hypothetical protein C0991_010998 [Blastosporella zonata]|nr:hypothetical protein C0991_010998 [Blastosporella zonata]
MVPQNPTISAGPSPQSSVVRVLLLATVILSLLFSAVFGTIGIFVLKRIGSQMTDLQQMVVTFHIFIQILFALFCFLGIASGAFCLYLLFNNTSSQPWDTDKCLMVAFDNFTRQLCMKAAVLKGLSIAMFVVMWLVEMGA